MTRDRARKKSIRARMAASGEPYNVAARQLDGAPAAGDAAALRDVIARAQNTLAASSARIGSRRDLDVTGLERPAPRRPGPIGRLVRSAAKTAWQRVAPGLELADMRDRFMHQVGEGFVEPVAGRYLIDYGSYAQALVDGQHFGGLSGRPLGPRYRERQEPPDHPLRVLRQLQSATDAWPAGDETLRGTQCRKVAVRAGSTEFTVWIDEQHIRQIHFEERTVFDERTAEERATLLRQQTFELWDFGVPVDALDWTHLPTFRSPA